MRHGETNVEPEGTVSSGMKANLAPQPTPDRPLTVMDIIDGSFNILRVRPKTVAAIVATFTLPVQLLGAWLARNTLASLADFDFASFDPETFDPESEPFANQPSFGEALFTIDWAISLLMLPFIGVAFTYLIMGWAKGIDRGPLECIRFAVRKTPVIVVAFIISKLAAALTLGLGLPLFILVAPVIAAEDLGPIAAVRRAFKLAQRRSGPIYGLYVSIIVVAAILGTALGSIPALIAFFLGSWGWIALFALGLVSEAVTTILGVGCAVLAYFDILRRTEGADIQRQIDHITANRAR